MEHDEQEEDTAALECIGAYLEPTESFLKLSKLGVSRTSSHNRSGRWEKCRK